MKYEIVIGLEVHVQLNTKTKIFCNCSTEFGAEPNTHICPVCSAQPGVLPVLNEEALEKAVRAGLAMDCEIAAYSKFDRKNYFYPDLPKGYQISQFDFPVNGRGFIDIDLPDGTEKRIGITRAHLEEDAGKLIHVEGKAESVVDLNRAGVPLLEIVSEPDMRSSEEAYYYLKNLRNIMKNIGVSNVNMEEGSLRCDANISIRPFGETEFGTKVEVKNMNSFNGVRKAIDYEVQRQIKLKKQDEPIVQETRLWDAKLNKTFSMRSKEEANDYRYFPEPDIPPVRLDMEWVEQIRKKLPEMPGVRKKRMIQNYGIHPDDAELYAEDLDFSVYFEDTVEKSRAEAKKISNWITGEISAVLNQKNISIAEFAEQHCDVDMLSELMDLIDSGEISGKIAKEIFPEMVENRRKASAVIQEKGLKQISDGGEIEQIVEEIIQSFPNEAEKYRSGKKNVIGFFVGQVMKKTKGQANPKKVNQILSEKLNQ